MSGKQSSVLPMRLDSWQNPSFSNTSFFGSTDLLKFKSLRLLGWGRNEDDDPHGLSTHKETPFTSTTIWAEDQSTLFLWLLRFKTMLVKGFFYFKKIYILEILIEQFQVVGELDEL